MAPKLAGNIHAEDANLQALPLNISSIGVNAIIAARDSTDVIKVYRLVLIATSANNLMFRDGANLLSGTISLATGQGLALGFDTKPWFATSPGNNFNIELSGSSPVTGILYFTGGAIPVPAPTTPPNGYVTEDFLVFYVAEDNVTFYVQE